MYARLWALVCLLSVGAAAPSEFALEGSGRIAVYLRSHPTGIPASVLGAMQRETGELMRSAGFRVQWLDQPELGEVEAAFLMVVGLEGSCSPALAPREPIRSAQRLAFTFVADGRVLPFSNVDCAALGQFLAPALGAEPKAKQDFLFGRAIGRLLAHELYHFVAQTKGHAISGLAQAGVSALDLISEEFTFGEEGLAKLRNCEVGPAPGARCGRDRLKKLTP